MLLDSVVMITSRYRPYRINLLLTQLEHCTSITTFKATLYTAELRLQHYLFVPHLSTRNLRPETNHLFCLSRSLFVLVALNDSLMVEQNMEFPSIVCVNASLSSPMSARLLWRSTCNTPAATLQLPPIADCKREALSLIQHILRFTIYCFRLILVRNLRNSYY